MGRLAARRSGGPDHDAKCVLPSTQTDQDEPFASVECVGPLEISLGPKPVRAAPLHGEYEARF
jgi:hypothetical protein